MAFLALLGFSVTGAKQAAAAVALDIPPLASNVIIETALPGFCTSDLSLPVLAGSVPLDEEEEEKKPWYKRAWFRVSCVASAAIAGLIASDVRVFAAGIAACVYISSG